MLEKLEMLEMLEMLLVLEVLEEPAFRHVLTWIQGNAGSARNDRMI